MRMRVSSWRRAGFVGGVALGLVLLLAACGGSSNNSSNSSSSSNNSPSSSSTSSSGGTAAAAKPPSSKTLVIARGMDVNSLDPSRSYCDTCQIYNTAVYETVIGLDPNDNQLI